MSKILRVHFENGQVLTETGLEYLRKVVGEHLVAGIVLSPGEYDLKPALWVNVSDPHRLSVFGNGDAEYKTQDSTGKETKVDFPDDGDIFVLMGPKIKGGDYYIFEAIIRVPEWGLFGSVVLC